MIMTVFDTLAMYLMITSDWISKLDDEIKIINNNQINYDTNELNKIETKNLQMQTNKAGTNPKVEIATNTTISDKSKFSQGAKG